MYKLMGREWGLCMKLQLLASYIFLGVTLAAPIGPVNSARLDKASRTGSGMHGWLEQVR